MRQKMTETVGDMSSRDESRPPTILKKTWMTMDRHSLEEGSQQSPRTITLIAESPNASPEPQKPKKKVSFYLSDMRRQSLTGSLPDLAKASEEDIQNSSEGLLVDLQISREPMPEASEEFREALGETDSDDESRDSVNGLNHSWNGDIGRKNGKKVYSVHGKQFESKAAALIYSKAYIPSLHKGKTRNNNTSSSVQNHSIRQSIDVKKTPPTKSESSRWAIHSPRKDNGILTKSSPCNSPASQRVRHSTGSSKPSPLVSGTISQKTTGKLPLGRQMSDQTCTRTVQRSKQKQRLHKSASVD